MVVTDLYIVQRATFPNFTADHTQEMEEELEEETILDIEFPIESDNQETEEEGGGNKVDSHRANALSVMKTWICNVHNPMELQCSFVGTQTTLIV